MFSSISWADYTLIILCCTILWYAGVVSIYYSGSLKRIFNSRKQSIIQQYDEKVVHPTLQPPGEDTGATTNILADVQLIIQQIKSQLTLFNESTPSAEITDALNKILEPYAQLRYSEFKVALTDLVQTNLSKIGHPPLTKIELDSIWTFK